MNTPCPGSHTTPSALVDRETSIRRGRKMVDSYGICRYCRREYYIRGDGTLHTHTGLPKRDGSCPYKCPGPECDFACYHPKDGAK